MCDYMTTEVITFLFFLYHCNDRKQGNFSFQFKRVRMEEKVRCLRFAGFFSQQVIQKIFSVFPVSILYFSPPLLRLTLFPSLSCPIVITQDK